MVNVDDISEEEITTDMGVVHQIDDNESSEDQMKTHVAIGDINQSDQMPKKGSKTETPTPA